MRPHFSKDTRRVYDSSEVDPWDEHSDKEEDHKEGVDILSLQVSSSSWWKDITCVVDDDDDHSCCDLVGHHWEDDEDDGHAVMQEELVVFSVWSANDEGEFE